MILQIMVRYLNFAIKINACRLNNVATILPQTELCANQRVLDTDLPRS